MHFINYAFMCVYIGIYLFYKLNEMPFPDYFRTINMCVCWGFLLWGGYYAGKVIIDCLQLNFKNQMTTPNMVSGILLAITNYLPGLMISVFMLKEGFK